MKNKSPSTDFIICSSINLIMILNAELSLSIDNLLYSIMIISFGIMNIIKFNDLYFQIKNKLDLYWYPHFYPSYRVFNNIIWNTSLISFIFSLSGYCFDYVLYHTYENTIKFLLAITTLHIILFVVVFKLYLLSKDILNSLAIMFDQIVYNHSVGLPIYKNLKYRNLNNEKNCWICNVPLKYNQREISILTCPCQEIFHSDCIQKYLTLYNNSCRASHIIPKFQHTA
jgi:hypothetical protein